MNAPFHPVADQRWLGLPVLGTELILEQAIAALPEFDRRSFGEGNNANPAFDTIVRRPWRDDHREVPVGIASPRYELVQHTAILRTLDQALTASGVRLCATRPGTIKMTPLGERLEARFFLDGLSFDPGDGHPLHLQLLLRNSVDGSCALELSVRWLRQICSNGMCVLQSEDRLREIHHAERFDLERVTAFLGRRTRQAVHRQGMLHRWATRRVRRDDLTEWICHPVREQWGPFAAIRLMHLCRHGDDGAPDVAVGRRLPPLAQVGLINRHPVPGAIAPADTLYAVYQALTWIADHRVHLEEREIWGAQALQLLQQLDPLAMAA